MSSPLQFKTRDAFRKWLSDNSQTSEGVWLLFGKSKALKPSRQTKLWKKRFVSDGLTD